jgi:hypothetical protein
MLLKIYFFAAVYIGCLIPVKSNRLVVYSMVQTSINKTNFINIPAVVIDSVSCIIPFSRAGNLIIVKAQADTTSGNFILDTGSPSLVLNITYFRDYPATLLTNADHADITGNSRFVTQTNVRSFSLGSLNYYHLEADLINLGNIENSKGIKILGLLGVSLFKDCEMIIDYEKDLIYLHRIARKEASVYQNEMLNNVSTYNTLPMDIKNNRMLINAQMAGKNLKFVIDCAAESNILDSRLPGKIFNNVTITRRVLLNGIDGKKVEALYGDAKNIKIGNQSLNSLPFLITNLEYTCFSQADCIDGVLGFDFLSQHKIGFNFVKRKMYIWKQAEAIH